MLSNFQLALFAGVQILMLTGSRYLFLLHHICVPVLANFRFGAGRAIATVVAQSLQTPAFKAAVSVGGVAVPRPTLALFAHFEVSAHWLATGGADVVGVGGGRGLGSK